MSANPPPIVRTFMTHEMRDTDIAALATGRVNEFTRIIGAIRRSRRAAPGTLQHLVLYGSRGFGKSFMTRRVQIETAGMGGKDGPVYYVLLAEEQHNLQRNPHAFLDLIGENLKHVRGDAGDADAAFKATMFQWPKPGEEGRRWDEAAARLEAEIDATVVGRKGLVIAVVENFDALLATLFKDSEDEQRLRLWLDRAGNRLMLFATATGTVDIHYDRPLFQAFESVRLQPWTPDECVEYFNRLRRLEHRTQLTTDEKAKARAIAEFIGGTPRLAQLLAEVIDTQEALTVADTMSALADRLAEYYRRRIDDLPQLARGLLDALIRGGEPASQTALAERVGAGGQNIIARTMADLERADIIRGRRAPDSREKLYSVTDRVFVHYYRLRQGSAVARNTPLATILDFLRSFYSRDEQLVQAFKHLEAGRPTEAGLFSRLATEGQELPANEYLKGFSKRLELYIDGLSDTEREPILKIAKRLRKEPEQSYQQCGEMDQSSPIASALCTAVKAQALQRLNLTNQASEAFDRALEIADKEAAAIVHCERYLFFRDGDRPDAGDAISRLAEISEIRSVGIRLMVALLATRYSRESGNSEGAIELARPMAEQARSLGKQSVEIQLLTELVTSFAEVNRYAEALEASERVSRLTENSNKVAYAASLAQTAILHNRFGHYEEATEAARRSVELAHALIEPQPRLEAMVLYSLALLLQQQGHRAEAEQTFARALKLARKADDRKMHSDLLRQYSQVLVELERFDEAADIALEAMELLYDSKDDVARLDTLSGALGILSQANRYEEVVPAAQKIVDLARAIGRPRDEAVALAQAAIALMERDDLDLAWTNVEQAVEIGRSLATPDLVAMLLLSAVIGTPLGKSAVVQNFIEALELLRRDPSVTLNPDMVATNAIFIGTAITNDFATLDAVLAEHSDWLIANSSSLLFTNIDGRVIGRMAQMEGRAEGYAAMAGLLPRIADFIAKLPPEKRDATWLPDLISGFAETCRDPRLLRDVAELLSDGLAPQAVQSRALLLDLASVDEARNADTVLARLNPDTATLIRRLRGFPEPESKPKEAKRRRSK